MQLPENPADKRGSERASRQGAPADVGATGVMRRRHRKRVQTRNGGGKEEKMWEQHAGSAGTQRLPRLS